MIRKVSMAVMVLSLLFSFTQCKKASTENKETLVTPKQEIAKLQKEISVPITQLARNAEFKHFILSECIKQEQGEYSIRISKIVSSFKDKAGYEVLSSFVEPRVNRILELSNNLEPILFYPRAETIEDMIKSGISASINSENGGPIIVTEEEDVPDNESIPGYMVDYGNSNLVYYQHITEEYAWENDVWVFGQEEIVSPENMVPAYDDHLDRVQGQAEYAGIIQIPNLNSVEHWIRGKLELRVILYNSSGAKIVDRKFGKYKRKHFRNNKWKDTNHFVGYWNTSTFGNWMYENWWEEDPGSSNSYSISLPAPAGSGLPNITTTIPARSNDIDMGLATIQFTDPITTVYNISYANIKRKN